MCGVVRGSSAATFLYHTHKPSRLDKLRLEAFILIRIARLAVHTVGQMWYAFLAVILRVPFPTAAGMKTAQ